MCPVKDIVKEKFYFHFLQTFLGWKPSNWPRPGGKYMVMNHKTIGLTTNNNRSFISTDNNFLVITIFVRGRYDCEPEYRYTLHTHTHTHKNAKKFFIQLSRKIKNQDENFFFIIFQIFEI